MKIGIVGSSGFIGKNLFSFLKENTNYKIFSFSSFLKNKKNWTNKIVKEIRLNKPDIIINCSANQNLNTSKVNLIGMLNSNLYSNILFVNEALKNKNFKGYISFGSKWELGDTKKTKPLNFYAATKKANDVFFKFYSNNQNAIVSLKIFDTYGDNDKRKKFLNELLNTYKKNNSLNITAGKQYLDYVHVNDISLLILKIVKDIKSKKLKGFKTFTVSSKKPIRLINLVNKLKKVLNKELKIKVGKKKYRKNESTNPTLNIFNYPGWKKKYNLISELKNIFDKR